MRRGKAQNSREGYAGIVCQRIPQRQRPVDRQLGNEPFRQGLEDVVLFNFGLWLRSTASAEADDRALDRAA